jgi:hypothetical protein
VNPIKFLRTRPYLWKAAVVVVIVLVALQFVPYRVSNPKVRDEPKWDSTRTRDLAVRACYDCHSNQTKVLSFEQVAPLSWWITNHVKDGRAALNFSTWHTSAGEGAHRADDAVHDGMPPSFYTWFGLHSTAKLSPTEVQELVDGLRKTIAADPPTGGGRGGG